jgi:hypothetical protein
MYVREQTTLSGVTSRSTPLTWSTTLMIAILGCVGCAPSDPGVSHPTPSNVLPNAAITARISMSSEGAEPLQALVGRLRQARLVRTFDGAGSKFRVDDLWVTPDGRPLVLDASSHTVRALHDDNTLTKIVSLPGKASASSRLTRLDGDLQGRVLVAGGGMISVHAPSADGYRFERTISSHAPIEDMCAVADGIYVRTSGRASILTRYSWSGEPRGAFGKGYDAEDLDIVQLMSKGRIACVGTPPTVVAAATWLPIVHGYGPDGAVKWIARFEDYKPPRLTEVAHRGHSQLVHAQKDFADRLWRVVGIDPHYVIVQLRRYSPSTDQGPHRILTYLLDAETGEGAYVGDTLPELYVSRGSLVYGTERTASHRVLVYTLEPATRSTAAMPKASLH